MKKLKLMFMRLIHWIFSVKKSTNQGMFRTAGELVCTSTNQSISWEEKKKMRQKKVIVEATVEADTGSTMYLEFGRTQAGMHFSARGSIARKLKPKPNERIRVTLEKVPTQKKKRR